MNVIKRDGTKEAYDIEKIHRLTSWAIEGLTDVSQSDIEINANLNIVDGIKTDEIHDVLVDSAANLISEEQPDYQYVAGRLLNYQIRKEVWGGKNAPKLIDLIKKNIEAGYYTPAILEWYTTEELHKIDEFINHDQDMEYTYCSVKQLCDKYLVKNRHTKELYETPQFRYIVASLTIFHKYEGKKRLQYIKKAYNAFNKFKINLATPQLAGLGTNNNSYASCFPGVQDIDLLIGKKTIDSIQVGDLVLTHLGNYRNVVATSSKEYTGDLVSLNTSATFNNNFESTSDHLIYAIKKVRCVRRGRNGSCNVKQNKTEYCYPLKNNYINDCSFLNEKFNAEWIESEDVEVGDFVNIAYSKQIKETNSIDIVKFLDHDIVKSLEYSEDGNQIKVKHHLTNFNNKYVELNNDVLRLIGLYYAEGDANTKCAYVQFTLNLEKVDYRDFILETFSKYFGIQAKYNNNTNDNSCKISVHSRVIANFFENYLTSGFSTKRIPKEIMELPPLKQKFLLKGIIDGDGFSHSQGIGIQLSNPGLILQIRDLALRNRLFPSVTFIDRIKIPNAENAARIDFCKTANKDFVNYVNKDLHKITEHGDKIYQNGFWVEDKYFSKVLSKETRYVEDMIVYDIQVDKDESFSANGIGVHNCCLIEMLDDTDSIVATNSAVAKATTAGYGIGVNFGRLRSINSPIKNGTVIHPGVVPFLKITESNAKAWMKSGIRGGSATVNFPFWHAEIETIVQLKNANTGTNDNRVFNLDYAIGMSRIFYERFLRNEKITLFCPNDVPGLYDAFGSEAFDDLYIKYENDKNIKSRSLSARELLSLIVKERLETGRIYILNIDNFNTYGCWNNAVHMSNLCVEIVQDIEPYRDVNDSRSEIGVCVLSATNPLAIKNDRDHEETCDIVVRMLDEIIDIQDYFDVAARNFCQKKRSLGIGVTNLAAFLAKNKVAYSDPKAVDLVDEFMEKQQYYLIQASIELAEEKGACASFHTSKYWNGWLPIDKVYKEELSARKPTMDWEALRVDLLQYGMRHTTLTAQMPCESSSAAQNVTNGIEPVRSIKTFKSSKKSSIPFLVPHVKTHGKFYELAFEMKDNVGYLNVANAMQRWIDMAMSVNQYFNPDNFADGKIAYSQIIKEIIHFYKGGGKSLYYLNSEDGNKHFEKDKSGCEGGACTL